MRSLRTTFAATVLAARRDRGRGLCPEATRRRGRRYHDHLDDHVDGSRDTTAVPAHREPPAIGTLKFFNAAGVQITAGNINDAPFAAYIQSSAPGRVGDTKATLFGYLPKAGIDWDGWSGDQLSASTVYPNLSAPAALASSSLPLVSLTAGDGPIAALQATYPHTEAPSNAYYGLYNLRVKTSGPGQAVGATFAQADIKITGSTWTVVYP